MASMPVCVLLAVFIHFPSYFIPLYSLLFTHFRDNIPTPVYRIYSEYIMLHQDTIRYILR